jgi:hypothetical protein
MGYTEDDEGRILDDVLEVGHGDEVLGEVDVREVAGVLVRLVDEVGEETLSWDLSGVKSQIRRSVHDRKRNGRTSRSRTHMLTVCRSRGPSDSETW